MTTVFEAHLDFTPDWMLLIASVLYTLNGIRLLRKRLEKRQGFAPLICPILFIGIGGMGLILFTVLLIHRMPTPLLLSVVPFLLLLPLIGFLNFDKPQSLSEFLKPIGLFIFGTVFCVIFTFGACFLMSELVEEARVSRFVYDTYQEGKALAVEGEIRDFHPMPETLHDTESFTVNGIEFYYGNHKESYFYSQCAFDGGQITRNGQRVKIWYVEAYGYRYIVRIDSES